MSHKLGSTAYGPAKLLKTACGLTQAGRPASNLALSWSLASGHIQQGSLGSNPNRPHSTVSTIIQIQDTTGGSFPAVSPVRLAQCGE